MAAPGLSRGHVCLRVGLNSLTHGALGLALWGALGARRMLSWSDLCRWTLSVQPWPQAPVRTSPLCWKTEVREVACLLTTLRRNTMTGRRLLDACGSSARHWHTTRSLSDHHLFDLRSGGITR